MNRSRTRYWSYIPLDFIGNFLFASALCHAGHRV